ncbi:MAG: LysR substrate-binding domain-containing protein [Gammaproteobacteria bacterium]
MDIALLKTFIEVNRTRHFGRAADNLFLTQSAVSARIRLLEETLGVQLFTRDRNNIQLTPGGARFLKHAESIVNAWTQACQDTTLQDEHMQPLSVGAMVSLWDVLLQDWIEELCAAHPDVALRAEAFSAETLIRRILDGGLDVGFMFDPPQLAELLVEELGAVGLRLVSTRPGLDAATAVRQPDYVMVDWGTSFAIAHAREFPDIPAPSIHMGLGRMALSFILARGGAAYLAEPMMEPYLADRKLYTVADAPRIERQCFAVYPRGAARRPILEEAVALVRERLSSAAAGEADTAAPRRII